MSLNINSVFDTHARSLALGSQRMELLAANIANADTPNFLARDIDFKAAMQEQAGAKMQLTGTKPGHIALPGSELSAKALYRIPTQPAQDGNTVDSLKEKAAVSETAVRFQASLTFLNQRIRGLKMAISGGR